MTEDNDLKKEGTQPNPSSNEQRPNAQATTEPEKSEGNAPNVEEKLKQLETKLDEVNKRYGSSSDEAIRLKKENDELKEALKKVEETKSPIPQNDEEFNQLVSEVGWAAAIKQLTDGVVKPLKDQAERDSKARAEAIYNNFKANHPGLEGDILAKFDKELEGLKGVYEIETAMEKAYLLAGGTQADNVVKAKEDVDKKAVDDANQSDEEKNRIIANSSGGDVDRKAAPVGQNDDLKKQLDNLKLDAVQKEASGRDATDLWIKITGLEDEMRRQAASKT